MFKDVETGEKLWSFEYGWGTVVHINRGKFPLQLNFSHSMESFAYTFDGKGTRMAKNQTLFWDEIKFEVPKKPLPDLKVDARVIVWDTKKGEKYNMYFKEFDDKGRVICFANGATSWTSDRSTRRWNYWEVAE